jgi:hypothetical protein
MNVNTPWDFLNSGRVSLRPAFDQPAPVLVIFNTGFKPIRLTEEATELKASAERILALAGSEMEVEVVRTGRRIAHLFNINLGEHHGPTGVAVEQFAV